MRAIRRIFLLAIIISTFAFFGALSGSSTHKSDAKLSAQQIAAKETEGRKETFTLLGVTGLAWVLCFWRYGVINRRLNAERLNQQRFNDYMRSFAFQRQYR